MAYEPELERLERRYQDDPGRNFAQLAETYRKAGRLDDALTLLRGHLAERPTYVSGLVVLGRCLLDQADDVEAREVFERVLQVDSEHIIALRALGEIAERGGDVAAAKRWFGRLLDVDPMNEDAEAAMQRLAAGPAAPEEAEPGEVGPSFAEEFRAELEEEGAEPVPTADTGAGEPELAELPEPPGYPEPVGGGRRQSVRDEGYPEAEGVEVAPLPEPADDGEAAETGLRQGAEGAEYAVEDARDAFMPRASSAQPLDVEQIGQLDIASQLPDDESLLSVPKGRAEGPSESAGERVVDFGFGDAAVGGQPTEGMEPTAFERGDEMPAAEDLNAQPFDDALGWGAGERTSRQVSREDIEEAEALHDDSVEPPVQELPGLERAEMPGAEDTEVPALDGLQGGETLAEVVPLEGLEPTRADEALPKERVSSDQGLPFLQTVGADDDTDRPLEVVPEEAAAIGLDATQAAEGSLVTFEAPKAPAAPATPEATPADDAGGASRAAKRRASLIGLPVIEDPDDAEAPLVLDAEPEPVVTETMAELYVRQGLVAEAREVYGHLLEQRPDDARLQARLAELNRPGRQAVAFAAADTGGLSVRAMLLEVLAARPGMPGVPTPASQSARMPAPKPEAQVPPPSAAAPSEPMDRAFAEEPGDEEPGGAPTHPASDDLSLAAIFGEAPSPLKEAGPAEAERAPSPGRAPGGFSFDEFFGKPAVAGGETDDRSRRDTLADDEGDEAFKDWLKSLKS